MTATTFDYQGYRQTLLDFGVPKEQAEGFTELARKQFEDQVAREAATREQVEREAAARAELGVELRKLQAELSVRDKLDEAEREKLATKGDVADVRLEVEKVRLEVERLRTETKAMETRLLRWQIGIGIGLGTAMLAGFGTLGAIMAKGFNWLGF